MNHFSDLHCADFIRERIAPNVRKHGALYVGNNLNNYLNFPVADAYAEVLKKQGDARTQKSSKDPIVGRLVEDVIIYLLREFFAETRAPISVVAGSAFEHTEMFRIVDRRRGNEKGFDVDVLAYNPESSQKFFLLSCKGSARERIGQYISHLLLMDERVIKVKYGNKYFLDFIEQKVAIKYGFVCMDWPKAPDFRLRNPSGTLRKTLKQTEVFLINDDEHVAGGLTVLNNAENLHGILNFGELAAKIAKFLG